MDILKNSKAFYTNRSQLEAFLLKGGGLVLCYYFLRILFKYLPLFHSIFVFSKKKLIWFYVHSSDILLNLFNYDAKTYSNIVYIEGSQGVRVINPCLGWSIMSLFIGFILIYPGLKRSKFWYIPLGLTCIIFVNILRIAGMVLVSYNNPDALNFYHYYIFNIALHLTVFTLWLIWVKKYGAHTKN